MQRLLICIVMLGCGGGNEGPETLVLAPKAGLESETPTVAGSITVPENGSARLNAGRTGGFGEVSYTWTQLSPAMPVGSFSSSTNETTQFKVPALCANVTFTIEVTARSGGQTAKAQIEVVGENQDPPYFVNSAIATVPGNAQALAGEEFTMQIEATAPGCGPKYTWSQVGTGGTITTPTNTNILKWRAPAQTSQTAYEFKVVVTDEAMSQSTERNITLTATMPTWNQVAEMFDGNCDGCHDGNANRGAGVNWSGAAATTTAMTGAAGASGSEATDACTMPSAMPYIAHTGNPDDSALYRRLTGTFCGPKMPRNNPGFNTGATQNYILRLESWLRAGAVF